LTHTVESQQRTGAFRKHQKDPVAELVRVVQGRLHHINDGANAPWKK